MHTDPNDDAYLIRRVLAGNNQDFAALIERHSRNVHALAANLLGRSQDIDDIAQEVFLAAYSNLHSFDPRRATFSTWLLTICRNKCLNQLRRSPPVPLDRAPEPFTAPAPLDQITEEELFQRLDQALDQLPFEQTNLRRIVALPGDRVETRSGKLFVNGHSIIASPRTLPTTIVPNGYCFVIAERQGLAEDSLEYGPVPLRDVIGEVQYIYWPDWRAIARSK